MPQEDADDDQDEEDEWELVDMEMEVDVYFAEDVNDAITLPGEDLHALLKQVEEDATQLMQTALSFDEAFAQGVALPESAFCAELGIKLCSDEHIRELNKTWRKKDAATDVLSFPQMLPGAAPPPAGLPMMAVVGDLVISLETAAQQAKARGHSLRTEVRILMVHGLLHLLGHDHEGDQAHVLGPAMAAAERLILDEMEWEGGGLIAAAQRQEQSGDSDRPAVSAQTQPRPAGPMRKIRLLGLDMDGTLLNSKVEVSARNAAAVRAAVAQGVLVFIATGKARPAAVRACTPMGLVGLDGIVGEENPGVFLNGLTVYGRQGSLVHSATLPPEVVAQAFRYSEEHGLALSAFTGDRFGRLRPTPGASQDIRHIRYYAERIPSADRRRLPCVSGCGGPHPIFRNFSLFEHPLNVELSEKYHEPPSEIVASLAELLDGPPVHKLLFSAPPEVVQTQLKAHWTAAVAGRASLTASQHDMLEILPLGASKGVGVELLLSHLGVQKEEVMACGDGDNDLEMLTLAGLGVAMGNASVATAAAADVQVGTNDEDGVAEAIERFILDPVAAR